MPDLRTLTETGLSLDDLQERYETLSHVMRERQVRHLLTPQEVAQVRAALKDAEGSWLANTLLASQARLWAEWTDLCRSVGRQFPEALRPAVRETPRRVWRYVMILAWANFAITGLALLYAIATGRFDWSAG